MCRSLLEVESNTGRCSVPTRLCVGHSPVKWATGLLIIAAVSFTAEVVAEADYVILHMDESELFVYKSN